MFTSVPVCMQASQAFTCMFILFDRLCVSRSLSLCVCVCVHVCLCVFEQVEDEGEQFYSLDEGHTRFSDLLLLLLYLAWC